MWSEIWDWAFHWILLWIAFELGKRWNEKEVHAAIAAITETQSRRISDSYEKVSFHTTTLVHFTTELDRRSVANVLGLEEFKRK
jgi:hypothetical protein